ncbi:TetR/AcrR family transcriptional regulator C-terminal domain-containing protein [Kitasatospora sp. NPDC002040]|uniref:TetR/AcrR family transcriptional regulator C-terminal domain-containing protein n=1 Tax=Kitasatospora sp. NPDC002040 TaxID=3154661 RepID=UPI00333035E9
MDRTDGARYRGIVEELRRRIERGELGPGERVPSTREITRQWGVAMATATKALTELRNAGLVRAVPGVGTVVVGPVVVGPERPAGGLAPVPRADRAAVRPRRTGPEPALTAERIVAAAVAIADAEGLAALSMRRVAAGLAVSPMALYRHVADKDDLLVRMIDAVFADCALPAERPPGWREPLALAARTLWDAFRAHQWLAPALSLTRPQLAVNALPFTEWALAALDGRGLDPWTVLTAHLTLLAYVRGIAMNVESESAAEADTGLDAEEWMAAQEADLHTVLASGRFPLLERYTVDGYDFDLDRLFTFGLDRLLDGIAVLLGESPSRP